jgi:membrane protein required for colicin V production
MEIIDIILISMLLYGAWKGYQSGFLIQVLHFISIIIALAVAFQLANSSIHFLAHYINLKGSSLVIITFICLFIITLVGLFFLNKFFISIIHKTLFGAFDQWAGAIVGFIKTGFALGAVIWLLQKSNLNIPNTYTNDAFVFPWLIQFTPWLYNQITYIIPFKDIIQEVEQTLFTFK